ncbi:zinc finger protein 160-like isoform X2 [Toxorhynchites rutilus septentrionalis]|uniref:zinc finger protein 160-like isoform X2 n=1 Tax=Toxorhynchites rutilus septentrionalis TaxID=329112 RepID=UPI002479B4F9|nr:zinc finger protein 160-like isoform X2 [Toxorhynchites rutilus septentrionalis]
MHLVSTNFLVNKAALFDIAVELKPEACVRQHTIMDLICRLCMEESNLNQSMADQAILTMVEECVQIKLDIDNDLFPVEICDDCYYKVKDFSEFKENCHSIQEMLRQEIEENRRQQDERSVLELFGDGIPYSEVEYIDESLLFGDILSDEFITNAYNNNNQPNEKEESVQTRSKKTGARKKIKPKRSYKDEYNAALVTCEVCGRMVHKTLIPGHLNMHKGVKPYRCPKEGCASSFHCKHKLKRHIGYKHSDGNFPCDKCDKTFNSNLALYHHKFATHQKPDKVCQECGKKFRTTHGLNRHMLTHNQERKFKCLYCPITFVKESVREIHHRTHTKERPFVCKECNADYSFRRLLVNHVRRKHPGSEDLLKNIRSK